MFETWGRTAYRRRWLVLAIAAIGIAVFAAWGTGVFGALQEAGGFNAPDSQSQQEQALAAKTFGRDSGDVVVLYSSSRLRVGDAAFRSAVTSTLAALPAGKVISTATYWSGHSTDFVNKAGNETYAVIELAGHSDAARITNSPSGRIRPVASAIGMNCAGETWPRVGEFQRRSASTPTISPSLTVTSG